MSERFTWGPGDVEWEDDEPQSELEPEEGDEQ
jgi:hypothetical protein